MSQVFVSYASPDRTSAKRMVDALTERGWSVFWDQALPPGPNFEKTIRAKLGSARCVIVLWSKASVESDWVVDEATAAAQRRILIPAFIEEVSPPFGFGRLQAARLIGWPDSHDPGQADALFESIATLVADGANADPPPTIVPRPAHRSPPAASTTPAATVVPRSKGRLRFVLGQVLIAALLFPAGLIAADMVAAARGPLPLQVAALGSIWMLGLFLLVRRYRHLT